jgi:integrase
MGKRRSSGLVKRDGIWHFDKVASGTRIRGSSGTSNLREARGQLAKRIEVARAARLPGIRPENIFRAATTKFLKENQHKRSIADDAMHLKQLDSFVGNLPLRQVHMGSLQGFIAKRRTDGVKSSTINAALAITRHILRLAGEEWMDDQGTTWLERVPKIRLLPVRDARVAYPLSREEQTTFFAELPRYLATMALFKVNTGCREEEVCRLKWEYEVKVPELDTSVFIVPGDKVKNAQDRLIVLNRVARSVVDAQRGNGSEYVFAYVSETRKAKLGHTRSYPHNPRPLTRMNGTAWRKARERSAAKWEKEKGEPAPTGFRRVRVHDMKHTFGRRLRAAGGSFEDRQDLLGHKSGRITTHYSRAELASLIAAANSVCPSDSQNVPTITLLRRKTG